MSIHLQSKVTSVFSLPKKNLVDVDPHHFAELVSKNVTTPGFLSHTYYGDRIEQPDITEWILNRDSPTPSEPSDDISKFASGPVNRVHVSFTTDPTKALEANITEILTAIVKPDKDLNQFSRLTLQAISIMEGSEGYFGTSWGYTLDDPRKVYILTGWTSKEVHEAFAQTKSVQDFLGPWLDSVTDIENYHVIFKHGGKV